MKYFAEQMLSGGSQFHSLATPATLVQARVTCVFVAEFVPDSLSIWLGCGVERLFALVGLGPRQIRHPHPIRSTRLQLLLPFLLPPPPAVRRTKSDRPYGHCRATTYSRDAMLHALLAPAPPTPSLLHRWRDLLLLMLPAFFLLLRHPAPEAPSASRPVPSYFPLHPTTHPRA
jgi:hypothetical protein